MANLNLSFALLTYGIVMFTLSLKLSMAGTVWLYGDNKFGELLHKTSFNSSSDCMSFPDLSTRKMVYVLTDTCVMVYNNKDCNTETNQNVKLLENPSGILKSTKLTSNFNAFQPCKSSKNSHPKKFLDNFNRQDNVQLNVTIFRSMLEMGPDGDECVLEILPRTRIYNEGNGTITQDYIGSRILNEYLRIDRSNWYTDAATVATTFDMEFENPDFDSFGPYVDRLTFPKHIRNAFVKGTEIDDSNQIYLIEQPHDFNVHELLQVPACTQYSIEASFQVNYFSFYLQLNMVVSGTDNEGNPIPAEELQNILPADLSYQNSLNDYEVIAQSQHYVTTEYGNFLGSISNGYSIGGC